MQYSTEDLIIITTNAATFIPKEKYDFIFSIFGGFEYSENFQKEIFLKYCYSLNKSGVAIFTAPESITYYYKNIINTLNSQFNKKFNVRFRDITLDNLDKKIRSSMPKQYIIVRRLN